MFRAAGGTTLAGMTIRPPSERRIVELSLDEDLLSAARDLDLDLSTHAEAGLRRAVAAEKARRWRADNAEAIRASNRDAERNGLWCDDLRLF